MSAEKAMIALVFEIDNSSIYMAMVLMNQGTTVLFQIVMLISKIQCLRTVVFLLVLRLADVVTKEQYPWILYYKLW